MISITEARQRILDTLSPLPAETVDIWRAAGRILAAPVQAVRHQPPYDGSAMDGFAIRASDLSGPETTLRLAGEARAGARFDGDLPTGAAIAISTGAPLPEGANQVVMKEDTVIQGGKVTLKAEPAPEKNVRRAGLDFAQGQTVLSAGQGLTPDRLGLAVAAGAGQVLVTRRPRIGVITNGDELREPGEAAGPDEIFNANGPALCALIETMGGEAVYLGVARDDPNSVRQIFAKTVGDAGEPACDLAVTIGGASVGAHDHLRTVFAEDGGQLVFEKIAAKPGKPTWFGQLAKAPFVGLPGNPVSALVMGRLVLGLAIDRLLGRPVTAKIASEPAVLAATLSENGPRETFMRAVRQPDGRVIPLPNQDSSALRTLAKADVLIHRESHASAAKVNDTASIVRV